MDGKTLRTTGRIQQYRQMGLYDGPSSAFVNDLISDIDALLADSERAERYRKVLEEISNLDWGRAAVNGCAYSAVMLAKSALQEPPHVER